MNNGRLKDSIYLSPTEGFRKVKDGHYAFFCEEAIAFRAIQKLFEPHEICTLKRVSFRRNDLVGLIIKKFSPLRERIFINLLLMHEVGIIHKVSRHWNGVRPTCTARGHFEGVRMEYLAPIFIFLILALNLSSLILICEIFLNKISETKIERKKLYQGRQQQLFHEI